MNLLEETEQLINDYGVEIDNKFITSNKRFKGCTFENEDGKKEIILCEKNIESSKEKRTILEHELQHCILHNAPKITASEVERKKIEHKTNVEMIKRLIDPYKLIGLIRSETSIWEIADYFQLSDAFIIEAVEYYRLKGII